MFEDIFYHCLRYVNTYVWRHVYTKFENTSTQSILSNYFIQKDIMFQGMFTLTYEDIFMHVYMF